MRDIDDDDFDVELVRRKLADLDVPGAVIVLDPEEADAIGLLDEPALTADDAAGSVADVEAAQ